MATGLSAVRSFRNAATSCFSARVAGREKTDKYSSSARAAGSSSLTSRGDQVFAAGLSQPSTVAPLPKYSAWFTVA